LAGLFGAVTGGVGREEDGAKVGLPSLDLSLAFPQATPASIFPPAGETFIHFSTQFRWDKE
jgi:acyl-CoA oxidase